MSGLFGSVTIKGNRLTEFSAQTSTVGIPIPFGYGSYPTEGNVIFAPMPPKEHVTKKKQGKGGVKSEEFTYTLSYAIAFCEGPIFNYLTIKRAGKVVYTTDPNASVEDAAYAAKWAQKATFYFGTETQLPDSTIESYKGAGLVSAHRGIAYIVVEDDDVTDTAGAVPMYEAVIIASPPDVYITSRPYPNDMAIESIEPASLFGSNTMRQMLFEFDVGIESTEVSTLLVDGEMHSSFVSNLYPTEAVNMETGIIDGEMKLAVIPISISAESVNIATQVSSGTMQIGLIQSTMVFEMINAVSSVVSGSMTP